MTATDKTVLNAKQKSERDTPSVRSTELFGNARELVIVHGGHRYRLRHTRSGKLILNK